MTGNKSENGSKEMRMLKAAMKSYCEEISRLSNSKAERERSEFRTAINYLYQALKTYTYFDLEKRLMQRVKEFRMRWFFMSYSEVEYEACALARELEIYLES